MPHQDDYIYADDEDFRNFVDEYAETDEIVEKINDLTDEEILDLVYSHIDEPHLIELLSRAKENPLISLEEA